MEEHVLVYFERTLDSLSRLQCPQICLSSKWIHRLSFRPGEVRIHSSLLGDSGHQIRFRGSFWKRGSADKILRRLDYSWQSEETQGADEKGADNHTVAHPSGTPTAVVEYFHAKFLDISARKYRLHIAILPISHRSTFQLSCEDFDSTMNSEILRTLSLSLSIRYRNSLTDKAWS